MSFIAGAVVSVVLLSLKIKKRSDEIPFGPFISTAALLYSFCGEYMIGIYFDFIKLYVLQAKLF
jgi:prepilin signal peptidase PulO-like enzyme (type II secretory pathway)